MKKIIQILFLFACVFAHAQTTDNINKVLGAGNNAGGRQIKNVGQATNNKDVLVMPTSSYTATLNSSDTLIIKRFSDGLFYKVPYSSISSGSVSLTAIAPLTISGTTISITSPLPIVNGGTNATTANTGFNNLAPSQTSNSGKYLTTDGSNTSWSAISAWALNGNSGTTGANFIGTTDNKTVTVRTNNTAHFDFDSLGRELIYGSNALADPGKVGLLLGGNSTNSYIQSLSSGRGDMIINGLGNCVGIGLTTPKATFHVKYKTLAQDSGYIFRFDNNSGGNVFNLSNTGILTLNGTIKINGGSPGTGKVLTGTDGLGNATWQTPSGGSTTITGTAPIIVTGSNVSITTAMADGSTKGAASFVANDFDAVAGNIGIDYTNGQAASSSTKGFTTAADWITFNGKQNALTFASPLTLGSNTVTLGNIPVTNLNSGTSASSSTFWRGDGTWAAPPGSTYFAGNGLGLTTNTFALTAPVSIANGGLNSTLAAGSSGTILRSTGSAYNPTTATYPNTIASQQLLFATGTNAIGSSASLLFDDVNGLFTMSKNQNNGTYQTVFNTTSGSNAYTGYFASNTSDLSANYGFWGTTSAGYTASGLLTPSTCFIFSSGLQMNIGTRSSHILTFWTANAEVARFHTNGFFGLGTGTVTPTQRLDVNGNVKLSGSIIMPGSSSGTMTIATPSVVTSYTLTAPANGGTNGWFLKTDGSGTTSWAAASGGSVTSVDVSGGTTGLTTSGGPVTSTGTISLGGTLALANGGTNASLTASNGGILYSTGSAAAILAGTAAASKMLLSGASTTPTWSTSTIPTSAGATANKVLLSDGTNYVLSTPTFPNASATARKIIVSDGTNWNASTETYPTPGTSGNYMVSNGTNWTSAAPTYTGTVTSVGISGGTTGLTYSGGPITTAGTLTVSGTLAVANGGTNSTLAAVANTVLVANAAGTAYVPSSVGTTGKLFQAVTGGSPGWTADINVNSVTTNSVSITNSYSVNPNALNITCSGDGSTTAYVNPVIINGSGGYNTDGIDVTATPISGGIANAVNGTATYAGSLYNNAVNGTAANGVNNTGGNFLANGGVNSIGLVASATGASGNNSAAIFPNGNVGIGNSTPTYKLDIISTQTASPNSGINVLANGTNNTGTTHGIYSTAQGGLFAFGMDGAATSTVTSSFNTGVQGVGGSANSGTNYGVHGIAYSGTNNYAGYFEATTGGTNLYGLYTTAAGGSNNYALVTDQGNCGIGILNPPVLMANTATTDSKVTANGFLWATANTDNFAMHLRTAEYGLNIKTTDNSTTSLPLQIINGSGTVLNVDGLGNVTTNAAVFHNSGKTTVSASTSGSVTFSQPEQGSTFKQVIVKCIAAVGTASYTFPTAFTDTPSVVASNDVAAGIVTSRSTTAITITGSTSTGTLMLIGY